MLQRGADHVFCLDVGTNQLAWKIRNDDRVTAREKFNARHLVPADLDETSIDLIVIDVSFISLTKILPAAFSVLKPNGQIVCLIKPQFELARDEVGKGGIVRDDDLRQRAVTRIREFVTVAPHDHEWRGLVPSPITGTDGNQEYLAWIGLVARTENVE